MKRFNSSEEIMSQIDCNSFSGTYYLDWSSSSDTQNYAKFAILDDPNEALLMITQEPHSQCQYHLFGNDVEKSLRLLETYPEEIINDSSPLEVTREVAEKLVDRYPDVEITSSYKLYQIDSQEIKKESSQGTEFMLDDLRDTDKDFLQRWSDDHSLQTGAFSFVELGGNFKVLRNEKKIAVAGYKINLKNDERYWFGLLYVEKEFRGKGYENELMKAVLRESERLGLIPATFISSYYVEVPNLIQQYGFKEISELNGVKRNISSYRSKAARLSVSPRAVRLF